MTDRQALRGTIDRAKRSNYQKIVMRLTLAEELLDELEAKDGELQEYRKASQHPIAWTDAEELRDLERDGCGAMLALNHKCCEHADPHRQIALFTAPKPLSDNERAELQAYRDGSLK